MKVTSEGITAIRETKPGSIYERLTLIPWKILSDGFRNCYLWGVMEINLYKSPKKAFKLILVSSIVVVCALFLLVTVDAPTWAWYPIIGVYGLVYPIALFHLFDRRPQIVITEFGIFDRRTCKDFINWDVIQRAWAKDAMVVSDVCLLVDDKYLSSLKKAQLIDHV